MEGACSLTTEVPLPGKRERGRSLGSFRSAKWRPGGAKIAGPVICRALLRKPLGAGRLRRLDGPEVRRVSDSRNRCFHDTFLSFKH
jgi:hypothetical protein